MTDPSPALKLREDVVRLVVRSLTGLTFYLYALVGALVGFGRTVPGELWLAAGAASGALTTLLVNSKQDKSEAGHSDVDTVLLILVAFGVLLLLVGVRLR